MKKSEKIKLLIKKECEESKMAPAWFYSVHLLEVEKQAKILARRHKANLEIVLLGVWLHDLQRIRGIKGDYQKIGSQEAGKVMKEYDYSREEIEQVKEMILSHSCGKNMPKSLESKILATADAMSHYYNDFYFRVAVSGTRNINEYKKFVLEKLDRNYNKKVFSPEAKRKIKPRHDLYKKVFNLK